MQLIFVFVKAVGLFATRDSIITDQDSMSDRILQVLNEIINQSVSLVICLQKTDNSKFTISNDLGLIWL